jgi:hydrogenase maturation protein HypF
MNKPNLTVEHSPSGIIERQRLTVQGVVQGVGFRPFVYSLAQELRLGGFVGNDSAGVFIEIEGSPQALTAFCERLVSETPPLAHLESVTAEAILVQGEVEFVIVHSETKADENTLISPDMLTCDDCLRELFDPNDRRYRYPFINCTNCGPRFTIIRDIPYDRPLTTMADFAMCPDCQAEYDDPLNRRFHAQPNACPVCGPQISFQWSFAAFPPLEGIERERSSGHEQNGDKAIQLAQAVITRGGIVAIKGLGGFHLACDATNDQAVQILRQRKGRVDKPFAIMALDMTTIHQFAYVSPEEEALLSGRERPIVLLKKKPDSTLSQFIAPGNQYVGVMLPYTPLHYLLLARTEQSKVENRKPILSAFEGSKILVMTSGNYSDEPIVKDNDEALERLAPLADAFLLHNRDIHVHCDDSVIRVFEGYELPVRRSRGYAPFPVRLPFPAPPLLAVGGELKSTFCLTKDNYAFMSQHIGDMENLETLQAFEKAVAHFKALFRVVPAVIVGDMHPRYLSTRWAQAQAQDLPFVPVQHHHAHIAAVMAEHGLSGEEPVIGFSFDGTGYGLDGAIWGGEVLLATYKDFRRAAHLKYIPLPGGDAAVKRPYRIALAHLWAAGEPWHEPLPPVSAATPVEQGVIKRQFETGFNTVPTSSMGRLFDAVASLAGVRQTVTYEAQAAIELESLADIETRGRYCFELSDGDPVEIDPAPVIRAVAADVRAGVAAPIISARFHHSVAALILHLSLRLREKEGLGQVALSGGVFQNVTLLKLTVERLRRADFEVLIHQLVPPNDGGLALGQAVVGAIKIINGDVPDVLRCTG